MREKGGVALRIVVLDGGTTNPGDLSWEPLEQLGQLTVYSETPSSLVLERLRSAQAAILNRVVLGREEFSQLPDLRYVGTLATGYNTIDVRAAREYGVTVCNVPRYCEAAVAQHALSLLLCLCNKVERSSCLVREGRWVELETLFRESDVVSLHCPLTKATQGLVDEKLLGLMKPTAFLINTARGGLLDEAALAQALRQGRLAGAGLDALTQEPPPPDHPLLGVKSCVITPHVAWSTQEARARLIHTVAGNLRRFQEGTPQNVVS